MVAEKRKTQKSGGSWKPRASLQKESLSAAQEKKSIARKKAARNDAKKAQSILDGGRSREDTVPPGKQKD